MLIDITASSVSGHDQALHFEGYLLKEAGENSQLYWDGEAAKHILKEVHGDVTPEMLGGILRNRTGGYALAWINPPGRQGSILLGTDRAGTFPLYIHISGNRLVAGTGGLEVARRAGCGVNPAAGMLLTSMEFVPGRATLAAGLEQVKPGELVHITADGSRWRSERHRYWRAGFVTEGGGRSLEEAAAELAGIIDTVAHDWSAALSNRHAEGQFAVPLSGGIDSRFLACAFAKHLGRRLHAVSYGDPNSDDVILAEQVAEMLRIPFHQVPFHNGSFLYAEARDKLARSIGLTCRLSLADGGLVLAERFGALRNAGAERDCTAWSFLPGHLAGVLTGAKLPKSIPDNCGMAELESRTWQPYTACFPLGLLGGFLQAQHRREIDTARGILAENLRETEGDPPALRVHRWFFEELVHRRVLPEMIVYRQTSYPVLPFGDRRLMDFFSGLSPGLLADQKLYRYTACEHFFRKKGPGLYLLPVQGRGPMVQQNGGLFSACRSLGRRLQNRFLLTFSPGHFERRYTSCPMFTLWRKDQRLREEVWREIENARILPRYFDHARLKTYLEQHLGKEYHLTSLGIWNLLTVELTGRLLEE